MFCQKTTTTMTASSSAAAAVAVMAMTMMMSSIRAKTEQNWAETACRRWCTLASVCTKESKAMGMVTRRRVKRQRRWTAMSNTIFGLYAGVYCENVHTIRERRALYIPLWIYVSLAIYGVRNITLAAPGTQSNINNRITLEKKWAKKCEERCESARECFVCVTLKKVPHDFSDIFL